MQTYLITLVTLLYFLLQPLSAEAKIIDGSPHRLNNKVSCKSKCGKGSKYYRSALKREAREASKKPTFRMRPSVRLQVANARGNVRTGALVEAAKTLVSSPKGVDGVKVKNPERRAVRERFAQWRSRFKTQKAIRGFASSGSKGPWVDTVDKSLKAMSLFEKNDKVVMGRLGKKLNNATRRIVAANYRKAALEEKAKGNTKLSQLYTSKAKEALSSITQ